MTPDSIRGRLQELDGEVNPTEYATALFYVRGDEEYFRACAAELRGGERRPR